MNSPSLPDDALARIAVRDTLELYFYGDDKGDSDALNACFTDDVRTRYDMHPEAVTITGRDAVVAAMLKATSQRLGLNHNLCNTRIEIDGDVARADTLAIAQVAVPTESGGRVLVRGLRYHDTLAHAADRWRISERLHQTVWQFDADATPAKVPFELKDREPFMQDSGIRGRPYAASDPDQLAIRELIERYFFSYDRGQEAEIAACFAPDAETWSDIGLAEPAYSSGREAIAREIAGAVRKRSGSHHLPCNMRIEIDGGTARSDMFAMSYLAYGDPGEGKVLVRGLHYVHDFVRAPEGWQIRKFVHKCIWQFEAPLVQQGFKS